MPKMILCHKSGYQTRISVRLHETVNYIELHFKICHPSNSKAVSVPYNEMLFGILTSMKSTDPTLQAVINLI